MVNSEWDRRIRTRRSCTVPKAGGLFTAFLRLLDGGIAKTAQQTIQPDIVTEIGGRSRRAQTLEVIVFELPRRILLLERHVVLERPSRRQYSLTKSVGSRPPLAQRADMRAAFLSQHVTGEMIAPGKQ